MSEVCQAKIHLLGKLQEKSLTRLKKLYKSHNWRKSNFKEVQETIYT